MIRGAVTTYIDVAQIVLYAFFAFFAGLIFYLRREDRREGYPFESEAAGRQKERGFLLIPTAKSFQLTHGSPVSAPRFDVDPRALRAAKIAPWPGAPFEPTGDPMTAEVGPGAYALRADVAEQTYDGRDLIVPIRVASNYAVASENGDPVGASVIGADGRPGGVVKDLWVDRGEGVLRYYEVETTGSGAPQRVLLPVTFSNVDLRRKRINVAAILGAQFDGVPATRNADQVTRLEEERITAYYGAGTLYATPQRSEPIL
jgi:photosynthetic reaction center H subunit